MSIDELITKIIKDREVFKEVTYHSPTKEEQIQDIKEKFIIFLYGKFKGEI